MKYSQLLEKIKQKKATIGVIGLGYVGLPLAILFAKKGFRVTGFLRDEAKASALARGENYLTDLDIADDLKKTIKEKSLRVVTMDTSVARKQDILIICVPTPVTHQKKPDIRAIRSVAAFLGGIELDGKLVINESTVAPGMTREVFGSLRGEYYLVCSPERVDPGNKEKPVSSIPKIVGGVDDNSQLLAKALYESVLDNPVVGVNSLETAEMVKMLENTYRAVNIALVNEFAKLCEASGIDVVEVINAAKTKWSFQPHYPGIGVGGHCIPVDPYYLVEYAKKKHVDLPLVSTGLRENEEMVDHVLAKVLSVYQKGLRVFVYGLAYKKNVKDIRESPAVIFCQLLKKRSIPFSVYDPFLSKKEIHDLGFESGTVSTVDILVVGTDHNQLAADAKKLIGKHTAVIDGRNFFDKKVGKGVLGVGRSFV